MEIEDEEEGSRSTIRCPTLATGPPVVQSSDSREKVIQRETTEKGEETALLGDGRRWGTGGSGAEEGQYYNSWTSRQGNCTAEFTIKIFTVLQNRNSQMKIFSSSVRSLKLLYNTLYPCTHIFMSISI